VTQFQTNRTTYASSSHHSICRMKDRCSAKNPREADRSIRLAIERGKRAGDLTSWESAYLRNEAHGGCTAVAYNGFCYIVNRHGICVTVHALPAWFGRRKQFDGKQRIRDGRKYGRYHAPADSEYAGDERAWAN